MIGVAPKAVVSLHLGVWQGGNNSVVECDLAKVEVAGSNPVSRSNIESAGPPAPRLALCTPPALRRRLRSGRSIELVDAVDCIGLAGRIVNCGILASRDQNRSGQDRTSPVKM